MLVKSYIGDVGTETRCVSASISSMTTTTAAKQRKLANYNKLNCSFWNQLGPQ